MPSLDRLHKPVLVLNASYEPINICAARRAVVLILKGVASAEELAPSHLHSAKRAIPVPSVIRLLEYRRIPHQTRALSRKNILMRDRYTCQYCHKTLPSGEMTLDHVVPRSQGGISSWANLVLSCVRCNKHKAGQTPQQAHMPLLSKPVTPKIDDPKYNFKLHIRKLRPEWKEWADWLYWNIEIDE